MSSPASGHDEPESEPLDAEASPGVPAAALARAAAPAVAERHAAFDGGYREIWSLSAPVMLSQVLVNAVALIDIAMVGRLGSDAVAAAGYAAQFFFLTQSTFFAVGLACVALMARAIGAGQPERARHALAASLQVVTATALVLTAMMLAAPAALLRTLGATPAVIEACVPYVQLLMGSSVLLGASLTVESAMRADKDTLTPMWVAAAVTLVKIALNALLIFGWLGFPRLELVGAGLATAISQAVGLALFAVAIARGRRPALALRAADFRASRPLLREVVRIAAPGVGERMAMNFGLLAYFRVLAEFGPLAIAAYTVGIRLLAFSWIPGTGFGAATATLVGQALGARQPGEAERVGWRATRLAVGVAIALGAVCALAREPLARVFTDDAALAAELLPFLLCLAIAQPFLQAHFTLGGAHRGAGDTWTPFAAAALGNWALRVPLAVLFAYALRLDVVWVWYALIFDHLVRTAWLAWSFRRGSWRKRADRLA